MAQNIAYVGVGVAQKVTPLSEVNRIVCSVNINFYNTIVRDGSWHLLLNLYLILVPLSLQTVPHNLHGLCGGRVARVSAVPAVYHAQLLQSARHVQYSVLRQGQAQYIIVDEDYLYVRLPIVIHMIQVLLYLLLLLTAYLNE